MCGKDRAQEGRGAGRGQGWAPRGPAPALGPRPRCLRAAVTLLPVAPQVAAINPNHPLAQVPLPPSMKNCIQLAACEASELLPMIPDLPADLFTSCLTTPIKTALRW